MFTVNRMALTDKQLKQLRRSPVPQVGNRLARAIELAETTQIAVGAAVGESNTYVSDVARGRYQTITVEKAHKFAVHFGCCIEDLFPPRVAVAS